MTFIPNGAGLLRRAKDDRGHPPSRLHDAPDVAMADPEDADGADEDDPDEPDAPDDERGVGVAAALEPVVRDAGATAA